jgi:hypothetical protein
MALHRNNFEIRERRKQVASLLSMSYNETEIAGKLGVDQSTIPASWFMTTTPSQIGGIWKRRRRTTFTPIVANKVNPAREMPVRVGLHVKYLL